MTLKRPRTVAWMSVFFLALPHFSCDTLNPAFLGQLGGDAGTVSPAPTGSIVLVFNNQTARRMALTYDVELSVPGEAAMTQTENALVTDTGYWTATFDCNTSAIMLTGIVPMDGEDIDEGLTLAVNEFRRPALQCGSVVFVNLPLLGSPTADLLP